MELRINRVRINRSRPVFKYISLLALDLLKFVLIDARIYWCSQSITMEVFTPDIEQPKHIGKKSNVKMSTLIQMRKKYTQNTPPPLPTVTMLNTQHLKSNVPWTEIPTQDFPTAESNYFRYAQSTTMGTQLSITVCHWSRMSHKKSF